MVSHPVENDVLCLCREGFFEEGERERCSLAVDEVAGNIQSGRVQPRELRQQTRRETELVASWVLVPPLELVGGRIIWQAPQLPPLGVIRFSWWSRLTCLGYPKVV